ncbi:MAG TPA: response regulator [Candidatus Angelobacter sp.]|jgi:FixJ family two-component response regulator
MYDANPIVFVVDDEPAITRALSRLITTFGFQCMTFSSAQEFLQAELPDAPGCLVLDVFLPGLTGLELQQKLAETKLDLPIIFMTAQPEVAISVQAMKAGAIEFLSKPFGEHELLPAIQRGIERHCSSRRRRARLFDLTKRADSLTPREKEVFLLVTRGLLNKQAAAELGIREKTIKVHRAQVMQKMNADSLAELVRMAEQLKGYTTRRI